MSDIPAFEDYLKKYAVYGLLALALGILSVYVSRETTLEQENAAIKSERDGAVKQLESMRSQYLELESKKDKTIETTKIVYREKKADGGEIERTEETSKDAEQSYLLVISHQQEIMAQMEQRISELEATVANKKVEIVRNAPKFALLAEYHYDGLTWIDRLRVGAGLNLGAWTVGATAQIKQEFNPALDVAFRF